MRKPFLVGVVLMLAASLVWGGCGNMGAMTSTVEKFPNKPISMIVAAAGGGSDLLARSLEKGMYEHLGQSLIVINKPGGGGTIGWNEMAGAKPDGYTLGVITAGALLQPLYGEVKYHYPTALDPIAQIGVSPIVLAIRPDLPWQTLDEFIAYAKQHPRKLKCGHSGVGSTAHIMTEMFVRGAGIEVEQVPFQGGAEMNAALLGGHIDFVLNPPSILKEYIAAGQLKVLAVAEEKRLTDPDFKNIPTFKERGVDVSFSLWQGIVAPKGLSPEVKIKLADAIKKVVNEPDYKQRMRGLGVEVEYLGPQEFTNKWLAENERLTKFVKESGIADAVAAQKK